MAAPQPDVDRPGVCGDGHRLASAGVLGSALADPPFPSAVGRDRRRSSTGSSPRTCGSRRPARHCVSRREFSTRSSLGFFHPTILIPLVLDEPGGDPELLRLSLLHEIAHADQSGPLVRHDRKPGADGLVFPAADLVASVTTLDRSGVFGRSFGRSPLRHILRTTRRLCCRWRRPRPASRGGLTTQRARIQSGRWRDSPRSARLSPSACSCSCTALFELRRALPVVVVDLADHPGRGDARRGLSLHPLAGRVRARTPAETRDAAAPPFRVTDFTAEPLVFSKGGRALSYVMPVALPSDFELNCRGPFELGRSRQGADRRSSARRQQAIPATASDSRRARSTPIESWHHVRLIRAGQDQISLWIDGRHIPAGLSPQATTEWLTFEPVPSEPPSSGTSSSSGNPLSTAPHTAARRSPA